jgi:shikimate kinase
MIRGLPRETKTIVLVGLMGAGKTCIGRRLARRLELPFVDTDDEVEKAAGAAIPEIFRRFGEQAFRDGERRVIARLLSEPPQVLATGGGAFVDQWTRAAIRESAVSVWLRAELDILVGRTVGRGSRPLLETSDPRATLAALMAARHPIYALADLVIDSTDEPPEVTTDRVLQALNGWRPGGVAAAEAGA